MFVVVLERVMEQRADRKGAQRTSNEKKEENSTGV